MLKTTRNDKIRVIRVKWIRNNVVQLCGLNLEYNTRMSLSMLYMQEHHHHQHV